MPSCDAAPHWGTCHSLPLLRVVAAWPPTPQPRPVHLFVPQHFQGQCLAHNGLQGKSTQKNILRPSTYQCRSFPDSGACLSLRPVLSSERILVSRGGYWGILAHSPQKDSSDAGLAHLLSLPCQETCHSAGSVPYSHSPEIIALRFPANSIFPNGDFSSTCSRKHKTRSEMEQAWGNSHVALQGQRGIPGLPSPKVSFVHM